MAGPNTAAFFDLDRTLIADSSGLLLAEALVEVGLLSERDKTLAELTRRAYRSVGETWIGMRFTRRSIGRLAGWSVEDLRTAARKSADKMEAAVYQEARELIGRHRRDGHLVVVATSTGRDIVEPLAERLDVDHLIASEYEREDGLLTGNLVGKWLWGPDKAESIRRFAEVNRIDLSGSYAYSDSFYDRHFLEMVGHPRAVNPDVLLRGYAIRKGWPVLEFRDMPGGPKVGLEPYDLARPFAHPVLSPLPIEVENLEGIPTEGPVIVAANHRSYLDPLVLATVASRRGRKLRYLGKKEVMDAPVLGDLAKAFGQIRVDRGTGDARPLEEAIDALERGEAIGIFPQGTIPRGVLFYSPELTGKTGVARLAAASGAPVVPVALWDTEKIWPRCNRVPKATELLLRRPVYARVGEPVHLEAPSGRAGSRAPYHELTQRVMDRIAELLPDRVRYHGEPTPDEIALATPPNQELTPVERGEA